jgi:hypothetical protein
MIAIASFLSGAASVGILAKTWKGRGWLLWAALTLLCEGLVYAYTQLHLAGVEGAHQPLHRAALLLSVGGGVMLMLIIVATLAPIEPRG